MQIMVTEDFLNYFGYSDQKTAQEMSSHELFRLISMLKKGGVNTRALMVDFYMKYSIPLTCFVFALIGIPLSLPAIRAGRAIGVIMCITVVFSFYVFASVIRSFGYGGIINPLVSAFLPQVTFVIFGSILFFREAATR
jgi:lipopolysaccharide export LptBFGC system permease protein LptF